MAVTVPPYQGPSQDSLFFVSFLLLLRGWVSLYTSWNFSGLVTEIVRRGRGVEPNGVNYNSFAHYQVMKDEERGEKERKKETAGEKERSERGKEGWK